jgi:hypothetical protein
MAGESEPAFPSAVAVGPAGDVHQGQFFGISKREWFAGMALQGILSDARTLGAVGKQSGDGNENVATYCYNLADAMVAAGGKEPGEGSGRP